METFIVEGENITTPGPQLTQARTKEVVINDWYPEQGILIEAGLLNTLSGGLIKLLKESIDVFAWKSSNMTGVPRELIEHKLNEKSGNKPTRQK